MKILLFIYIFVIEGLFSVSYCQFDYYFDYSTLDANQIIMRFNNFGNLEANYLYGADWKRLSPKENDYAKIVFDQGIWVIGKLTDIPHLSLSRWISYYSPGPITDGNSAMLSHPEDFLLYRVYSLSMNDLENGSKDIDEWPTQWGAPADEYGNPVLYNDKALWTVYNGYDSSLYRRKQWNEDLDTLPVMPVEVQQLAYAFSRYSPVNILSNVVFLEYTIINKGLEQMDSCYIGFWTDIDFYNANANPPAVDVENQLGYCWSGVDSSYYNYLPPAVGYTLLYGPIVPSTGDSALFKSRKLKNFTNLKLSSFYPQESFFSPLSNYYTSLEESWNIARGLDSDGNNIINPITGEITKFPFDGDPVAGTGWIFPSSFTDGEAGFVFFSGPFTLAPNDTQWVMIALVPGLGTNRFESIRDMQNNARILHTLSYDDLVQKTVLEIHPVNIGSPDYYYLSQNYPNPFNPTTKIDYEIPVKGKVELNIYNLLGQKIAELVNEEKEPGRYSVTFDRNGLASGVYFYRIQAGSFIQTKKMILLK